MKNILEVKNLSVELANEKIINVLSFVIKKGDFLTIIGPNGSGKTILLRTLLGLIPNYTGEIKWQKNIKIGYLPQGLTQLKVKNLPLCVEEFLGLKKVSLQKIKKFLSLVGLNDKTILRQNIGTLSSGQFQRMLLAWALLGEPNVLMFDEPTTGVDIGGEKTVYDLLKKIWQEQNLTILLITHDLNVIYKYSNSVLCLSRDNTCHAVPREISAETLNKIYHTSIKFYQHNH